MMGLGEIGGPMPRLDNAIDIKAPRDVVFKYVSDVLARPEWVKWTKQSVITSEEPALVGQTDAGRMQVGPQKQNIEAIVTEYKPGELFTRRHTRGIELTDRIACVANGDTTKVAWSVEYTPPMGAMGKMVGLLFMDRLMEQLQGDSLEILKLRLETAR
jgi:uncharacterized membrane protein